MQTACSFCSMVKEKKGERMTYNDKIQAVADVLLKYCDPRPEFSGLMAKDIAKKILEVLEGE